jgi:WD40 repeat protein
MGDETTAEATALRSAAVAPGPGETSDGSSSRHDDFRVGSAASPPGRSPVKIFGDFELTRELGRGGMGVVFQARQISLNRPVALKMIRAETLASEEQRRRFRNEAEAVATLDHPKIVPIFEVGEHEGQPYFAMKLIDGAGLDRRLEALSGDFRAVAELVASAAEAVHHAHCRGILHRDLKPANILVDAEGRPHITDFGLAKRIEGDSELTNSGSIVGTPAFMAPEQASGRRGTMTTATDVYGLGSVLYCLLAGRPPFVGDSVADTLEQVRERAPEPPSRADRQIPKDLEVICLKCLEKSPSQRYHSAEDLVDDLRKWLAGEPIRARPVGPATRIAMWCRRRPALAGLASAAGLLAVLVAVLGAINYVQTVVSLDRERGLRREIQGERDRVRLQLYLANARQLDDAYQAADMARLDDLLDDHLPRDDRPDLRQWEWFYFNALAHSDLRTLGRFEDTVSWSPDGLRIAASRGLLGAFSDTARIAVYDADTGQEVFGIETRHGAVPGIGWSPDGTRLASVSLDGTLEIRDAATGEPTLTIDTNASELRALSWSPDGRRVAVGGRTFDNRVEVRDAGSGDLIRSFPSGQDARAVLALAWDPGGSRLASAYQSGLVVVWDVRDDREHSRFEDHEGEALGVAWSPDGRMLASVGEDGVIRVRDPERGLTFRTLNGHQGAARAVSFGPGGWRIATGGEDRVVRIWDVASGEPIRAFRGHQRGINAVSWSPNGLVLASSGDDGEIKLWDPAAAPEATTLSWEGTATPYLPIAWEPPGHRLAVGQNQPGRETVALWDVAAGRVDRELRPGREGDVRSITWSPSGRRLLAHMDNLFENEHFLLLWDGGDGKSAPSLGIDLDGPPPRAIGWLSEDRPAAVVGQSLRSWELDRGGPTAAPSIGLEVSDRGPVAFGPGGRRLASMGPDESIQVLDSASGRILRRWEGSEGREVALLAWDAGGRRLAVEERHSVGGVGGSVRPQPALIRVLDAESGEQVVSIRSYDGPSSAIAWPSEGERLASAIPGGWVTLWDVGSGQPVLRLSGPSDIVSLSWTTDGWRLAAAGREGSITIWDAEPGLMTNLEGRPDDLAKE